MIKHLINTALVLVASIFLAPALDAQEVNSGHSAVWYDPARAGEGWVLEILPDDRAAVYWFTYDESGGQRWLVGPGKIVEDTDGKRIEFQELWVTHGAEFGPGFDPNDVEMEVAGNAIFRFNNCDEGVVSVSAFGQAFETPLIRLTRTMGAECLSINGVPGEPVRAYAGQSGSWYDVSHIGEGFTLQWMSRDEVVVYWFSYDDQGNQAWMFGVGRVDGDQIEFRELLTTSGAVFGNAFSTDDVAVSEWGELTMTLECLSGELHYDSPIPGFGSGSQNLTRLTVLVRPGCPYVRPKFSDLYAIEWLEIPIEPDTVQNPNNVQSHSVADDGTIVAHKLVGPATSEIVMWRPNSAQWDSLDGLLANSSLPVLISPSADMVIANERMVDSNPDSRRTPAIWEQGNGWQRLSGMKFDQNLLFGASEDRSVIVGIGEFEGEVRDYPWVWTEEGGFQELPLTEEILVARPQAVSNDGKVVVGHSEHFVDGAPTPTRIATRWLNGGTPKLLRDEYGAELDATRACNSDCSIVSGGNQAYSLPEHPAYGQAWFWKSGQAYYLGGLPDAILSVNYPYIPNDITADGSLIVGAYAVKDSANEVSATGFVWTQVTGMVSIRDLIEETGWGDTNWDDMIAISVSSSGNRILLTGKYGFTGVNGDRQYRAVLLKLQAKTH